MLYLLSFIAVACAALPCLVFLWNFGAYDRLRRKSEIRNPKSELPGVSLLIPARHEERSIEQTLTAALANRDVDLEVIVLDDHSTDRTAAIVQRIAADDPRVRLATAPPLPAGWCGKQHACHTLGHLASHELMVFIDADVTLSDDALRRIIDFMDRRPWVELASGFPRQITRTFSEKLVIPLITYVLLGYLPLRWSRVYTSPGFGAVWFWTVALLGAAVLPWVVFLLAWSTGATHEMHAALAAIVMGMLPRFVTAVTARESWLGALLHPVGITMLIVIQWAGLLRHVRGAPQTWKGRAYGVGESMNP